ncbi:ribonuclease H-like domain-containing protein [Desulfobacula sp.]
MLKNSFQHIPGIGSKTERQLWESGIFDWGTFAKATQLKISPKRKETITDYLEQSNNNLHSNNPRFFCDLLPAAQHWCIFPEFRNTTAYIDIETTGLERWDFEITTIALYDGCSIKYYVNGQNLDDFIIDIAKYNVIVTYNGKSFDVPFIEDHFKTKLNHSHIDLRYILKSLGYSGGLKSCEKALGMDRGDLDGVDGYFAILLWHDYKQHQNEKALETLLAYNIEDVINLETLMVKAYNMKIKGTPFLDINLLPMPSVPKLPFKPDSLTIDRIRRKVSSSYGQHY